MSQITLLQDLQAVDTEIQDKKERLAEVLALLQESAELKAARAAATAAATELRRSQARQHDLELQHQSLTDKRGRSQERLYSGSVKNAKELMDLQNEVDALARRLSSLEDEILDAMGQVEEARRHAAETAAQLAALEEKRERKQGTLTAERQTLAARLTQLLEQRKQITPLIEARYMTEYEQIRRKRRGSAVVPLDQFNLCSGCRMTVSAAVIKLAHEGQYVLCGNCGRIITTAPAVA